MKEYFAPILKGEIGQEDLPILLPTSQQLYNEHADPDDCTVLRIGGKQYRLMQKEQLPEDLRHEGYLTAQKKPDKHQKPRKDGIALLRKRGHAALITEKRHGVPVGFLQTQSDSYLSVTRPRCWFPLFLLPVLGILLALWVYFFWVPATPPVYGSDPLLEGGLTPSASEQLDPAYFHIKMNATPILRDGKMNLRIENSQRNLYNCVVQVEIEDGPAIRSLYQSPLIRPDQALEFATVEEVPASGVYSGYARFTFYDDYETLLGKATVKLTMNVI